MKYERVKQWMMMYSFEEVLKWIQCTSVHPNNQLFQMRFENLIDCLITINKSEFKAENLTREIFEAFINEYYKETNEEYEIMEDFNPFDQLKQIPYYYNGKEYLFFYGALERPYEYIEKFDYLYLRPQFTSNEKNIIRFCFEISLSFQTKLLERIKANSESYMKHTGIYIPTERYINDIWDLFIISEEILENCPQINLPLEGEILGYDKIDFAQKFNSVFLKSYNDKYIFLLPQVHIEVLYNLSINLLFKDENDVSSSSQIFDSLRSDMLKDLTNLFSRFQVFDEVVDDKRQAVLSNNILYCRINEDILLVLYLMDEIGVFHVNIDSKISNVLKEVTQSKLLTLKSIDGMKISPIPNSDITIIPVVLYDIYGINGVVTVESQDIDFQYFEFLDFKRMLEVFSRSEDLFKYLRELKTLQGKTRLFISDQIDKLAIYIENGNRFLEMGLMPDITNFPAHSWHDYYMEYLYSKYLSGIHKILEGITPYYYNHVEEVSKGIYECCNTSDLKGGLIVKCDSGNVFIRYPVSGLLIHNGLAVRLIEKVLKPLFAEYIQKLYARISDILFNYGFKFGDMYYIELVPIELVVDQLGFNFLKEYLVEITPQTPIIIKTLFNKSDKTIHSFVITNADYLVNIFDSEFNNGERYCINELIKSLLGYCFPIDSNVIEFASQTTDLFCPVARRRYGITTMVVLNQRSKDYNEYHKINLTDLSSVNREVAEHLKEIGIQPRAYLGQDAIQLNVAILSYLSSKLAQELSKYNETIINYAYLQLEYAEHQRTVLSKQRKYDIDTDTDFDVVEKAMRDSSDISRHSIAIKHIIAAILKHNPKGNKYITKEGWSFLLAITFVINDIAMMHDLANFKLQTHQVTVSDLYEIRDNFGDMVFNSELYNKKIAESKLFEEKKKLELGLNDEVDITKKLDGLNNAFLSEFHFQLLDMLTILYYLGTSNFNNSVDYPLNRISIKELVSNITSDFKDIEEECIYEIIKYLSIDYNCYTNINVIAMANLMRYKIRINLCPLINMGEEVLYGNEMCLEAYNLWVNYFNNGDSPYQIDLPKSILKEVKAIHKEKDLKLEKIAEKIAQETLGEKYVEATILNFKRLSDNFIARPECGEIDLLAVNPNKHTIFVIDAKNVNKRFRPYDMAQEISQFFDGQDSYYNKLNKKYEFIFQNIEEVLRHFEQFHTHEWKVKKAFFVDNIYPSAFIKEDIAFILPTELSEYLNKG